MRQLVPAWEALEERQLLSGAGRVMGGTGHGSASSSPSTSADSSASQLSQNLAQVRAAFKQTVTDLDRMQAGSHVTRAEVQTVARDLAEWPHPPDTSIADILRFPDTNPASFNLGVQIDYMYIEGSTSAKAGPI